MTNKSIVYKNNHDKIIITTYRRGRMNFSPVSYPTFEGIKHQVEYRGYRFIFDLTGHIKWILNNNATWPDPSARIKRSIANEWMLYLTYGYEDVYALTGVYYIPIREKLDYIPVLLDSPFKSDWFKSSLDCLYELIAKLCDYKCDKSNDSHTVISKILKLNKEKELNKQANIFHSILKGTVPILPPDTIGVDYNVIPLLISDGCLYNCKFCCLKTGNDWRQRSWKEIIAQIDGVRGFLEEDIINYPGIFLGQNDALSSKPDVILDTANLAFNRLINKSIFKEKFLYLFGSTTSLLNTPNWCFKELSKIGYKRVYINCGLESFEQGTLDKIGKPVSINEICEAYKLAMQINRDISSIEISFNFLISKDFSDAHLNILSEKISSPTFKLPKGTIYISPMIGEYYSLRELKNIIFGLKANSKWDVKLYLMQGI